WMDTVGPSRLCPSRLRHVERLMDHPPPTPPLDPPPTSRAIVSRRWLRGGAVLLVLALATGAVVQLWSLHTRDLHLQQIADRLTLAERAAAAGDVAHARKLLPPLDDDDAVNAGRLQAVVKQCERMERCADFLRQARPLRAGGAHLID